MRTIQHLALIAATVTTGLVAGLLGAFACAVMPALRGADDRTFIDVMQRINVSILNPVFLSVFMGGLVLTITAGALHLEADRRDALPWIIAGLVLYLVVLGITGRLNVPLNDTIAAAGDPHTIANPAAVRHQFENPWVAWNIVRTLVNIAAVCCLAEALVVAGRTDATVEWPNSAVGTPTRDQPIFAGVPALVLAEPGDADERRTPVA